VKGSSPNLIGQFAWIKSGHKPVVSTSSYKQCEQLFLSSDLQFPSKKCGHLVAHSTGRMSSRPSIVIVPGAWHSPAHYARLAALLQGSGYPCVTVALPSVSDSPPPQAFEADVSAVRNALFGFVNDGRDVIAILHSYGGIPGSEAMRGLAKTERSAAGGDGGVVGILFIASMLVPQGESLFTARRLSDGGHPSYWDVQVRLVALVSLAF
jgi:pimeloyl-ACP methyl ester carboxylesterase